MKKILLTMSICAVMSFAGAVDTAKSDLLNLATAGKVSGSSFKLN